MNTTIIAIEAQLSGAARGPEEAARILRRLADHLEQCNPGETTHHPIHDANGNRVGRMEALL